MADFEIEVVLPRVLDELPDRGAEIGRMALAEELAETLAKAVTDPSFPKNLGNYARSLRMDVRERKDSVEGRIEVAGPAAKYGAVMEFGRRPGARGPSWRHLYFGPGQTNRQDGWRSGWVFRRLRSVVTTIAGQLRAKDAIRRAGRARTGRLVSNDYFLRRATLLLSIAIARKIKARGIKGRRNVTRAAEGFAERFETRFLDIARDAGLTGGSE